MCLGLRNDFSSQMLQTEWFSGFQESGYSGVKTKGLLWEACQIFLMAFGRGLGVSCDSIAFCNLLHLPFSDVNVTDAKL